VLTDRDETAIRKFIDLYVDAAAADEVLKDSDLMFQPSDPALLNDDSAYAWEPAKGLENAIHRGLKDPAAGFALYVPPSQGDGHATIGFTLDGNIVLGVEVDDPMNEPGPLRQAKKFLNELLETFDTDQGFICVEDPPPMTVAQFQQASQDSKDRMKFLGTGL